MTCTTAIQMTKIATVGAQKMDAQGYVIAPVNGVPHVYRVTSPVGTTYRVSVNPATGGYCGCKFYAANRAVFAKGTCTCKHMEYLRHEEAYIARIEEEAAARAEAEEEVLWNRL